VLAAKHRLLAAMEAERAQEITGARQSSASQRRGA
jgi:hypothetical protein